MDVPLVFAKKRLTHETIRRLFEAGYFYCPRCQQVKELAEFRKGGTRVSRVYTPCKACEREDTKARSRGKPRRGSPERRAAWLEEYRARPEVRQKRREAARRQYTPKPPQPKAGAISGIYVLQMGDVFKLGKSIDVHARVAAIRASLPFESSLVHVIPVEGDLSSAEWSLHQRYAPLRRNGEWFSLSPSDLAELLNVQKIQSADGLKVSL